MDVSEPYEPTDEDLRRLGRIIEDRLEELLITHKEAMQRADLSPATWNKIVKGTGGPRRNNTYARVDRALGWTRGSCKAVLAGGKPTTIQDAAGDERESVADGADQRAREAAFRSIMEEALRKLRDLP